MRRVVITGVGVIGPLGNTPEALWERLAAGRSGVTTPVHIAADALPAPFAGEAHDFQGDIGDFGELPAEIKKAIRKGLKVMCRESQMGIAAAQRALADARLTVDAYDPTRRGIEFGSDYMLSVPEELAGAVLACLDQGRGFDFAHWGGEGLAQMNPLWLLKYLPNMPASHIAIFNDLQGPNNSLTHREASGNLALGEAMRIIQRGHADMMLAGATGTRIHAMKSLHAALQEEVVRESDDPARVSRPFDRDRRGMVLGEGAGAVVLEEFDSARARGARIYGELCGAGASSAVDRHGAARRDRALANAMRAALADARATPEEVGHINAHGLSTRSSDADEARAIHDVFAETAALPKVSAAKSFFGNLGAGSAMVELAASLLSLAHDRLFPTLNFAAADADDPIVPATTLDVSPGDSFLSLSVTPQAQASVIFVRRSA